jgi:hypothetical protein
MRGRIQSGLVTAVAAVGIGALAVAPTAPPPEAPAPPTEVHDVRLAAAIDPPLGAIPLAFIRNQFQYCSVICPYVVQGAVTVPVAVVLTPVTFLGSLQTTGSLLRSIGAAAASVTGAANDAFTPIIENDVYRVVPKAFNNLEVAVVQLFNVGAAVFQPGEFLEAVQTARAKILAALNQPLPPPAPTETGADTLPEVVAAEAIRVFSAVVFQAGELLLLGIVQTADAFAQELAQSGDLGAAFAAGAAQATDTIATAGGIVRDAVDTAATNIRDVLADPVPSSAPTTTSTESVTQAVAAEPDDPPSTTDEATTTRRGDDTTERAENQRTDDDSAQAHARDLQSTVTDDTEQQPTASDDTEQQPRASDNTDKQPKNEARAGSDDDDTGAGKNGSNRDSER